MTARRWWGRLPRLIIGMMVVALVFAVVAEVVSGENGSGPEVDQQPVPTIESRTYAIGQEPSAVFFDGERLWVAETGFGTVTSYGLDGQRLDTADVGGRPATLTAVT